MAVFFLRFFEMITKFMQTGAERDPVLTPTDYPGNVTGGQMFRRFYWLIQKS